MIACSATSSLSASAAQRLLHDFQIVLLVGGALQAEGQGEAGVVGHRRQLFGELLVRFAQTGDHARAGGGNGLALGDGLTRRSRLPRMRSLSC
jgi:hypothetical protein